MTKESVIWSFGTPMLANDLFEVHPICHRSSFICLGIMCRCNEIPSVLTTTQLSEAERCR